ncbi:DUF1501 domain-containing protein [Rhabdobacter roseus]|uniref:DUF1501 domain-containing protein n=1 Tax=Rhabdobacter roseus TaxID=1655419 RepID=A0A840TLQ7_9BACT|nr:DUF1501 domain-containing protein [Rhabdobacter roseus]MBB5284344.1 hypothetical protein [Rhabdobacter roseus]
MEKLLKEVEKAEREATTRRYFLQQSIGHVGAMALGGMLMGCDAFTKSTSTDSKDSFRLSHFAPKAKRVIFLHMSGAPSQLELFENKPLLRDLDGKDCPQSLLEGKRFAFIVGTPQMLGPYAEFEQYGQTGSWVSHHMPYFQSAVDEVTFLRAMHTDEFNHAPAQLFMHTGGPRTGRPSFGSWVTYGLGTENANLPGFIVLASGDAIPSAGKSIWGSGFLPSQYQGVQCRSEGDPVLYIGDPKGMPRDLRKAAIQTISEINRVQHQEMGDPEILARIEQYELAFRMQTTVPEAMDITREPDYIHQLYGTTPGQNSYANNCLLARRLAERGVRFIQLYHADWDTHGSSQNEALEIGFVNRCRETDQATTALLTDLKQRGLLDDTLVVWGGEFGRTPMAENRGGKKAPYRGRDHHKEAFTMWMAGGGVKQGFSFGETDEIGYYGVKDRVHVHDLQATILHLLGFDHEKLTYPFQGRNFRLTDVHGKVVKPILA